MTEKELRWAFRSYPSVVTIPQMKKMLDVKKDHTLYKLLHTGNIQHFEIKHKYFIPKASIIDYLLCSNYLMGRPSLQEKLIKRSGQK